MKYLRIHLRANPGSTEIIYPVGYQNEIGVFAVDHLYYDVDGAAKLLLCIPDKDYKIDMIRTDAEEITEVEAKTISEANETRTEIIKDEAKVRRIEIASRLGMTLSKEDQDAIDPTKPDSAFGVSEILADRVEKLKANEIALAQEVIK